MEDTLRRHRLRTREAIGPRWLRVTLDDPNGRIRDSFRVPGQYVRVRLPDDEKAKPYALYSLIGEPPALLVRADSVDHPWRAADLTTVDVSAAEGKGFPVDKARADQVLVVGIGTGVAPLRSLVEALSLTEHAKRLCLVIGTRSLAENAVFADDAIRWRARGVDVRCVVSQPDAPTGAIVGRVDAHLPTLRAGSVAIYAVGHGALDTALRTALAAQGHADVELIHNY